MSIFHSLTLVEQGYQNIVIDILRLKYYSNNQVYNSIKIDKALENIRVNAEILYKLDPDI
jgi:hypothetical protein